MRYKTSFHTLWTVCAAVLVLSLALLPASPALAETAGRGDLKFSGVIDAIGADAWTIAGYVVLVNASTQIRSQAAGEPGMWAAVTATRQTDGALVAERLAVMEPEVRIKGPATAKPADGLGEWTIAGQPIVVTAETLIGQRGGPVDEGYWVEVYAIEDQDDNLVAVRMRGIEPLTAVEIFGAIQSASAESWVISTIAVAVGEDTLINGDPAAGLLAHAATTVPEGADLLALRLKVLWQETGTGHTPVSFTGIIEALPPSNLHGQWQIDGQTVIVTANTAINEEHGLAVVGAEVTVEGWQGDGVVIAQEITVLASPEGGEPMRLNGRIDALPQGELVGTWVIDGYQVQVTTRTRIEGAQYARIGAPVEVRLVRRQNGEMTATWLRVREGSRPGPGPRPSTELSPATTR